VGERTTIILMIWALNTASTIIEPQFLPKDIWKDMNNLTSRTYNHAMQGNVAGKVATTREVTLLIIHCKESNILMDKRQQ